CERTDRGEPGPHRLHLYSGPRRTQGSKGVGRYLQVSLALATCRWPLAVGDGGLERKQPAPMKREWPAHMGGPFACNFFMVDHSSVMRRPEIIVRIASHVIRRRFEPVLCRTLRARLS